LARHTRYQGAIIHNDAILLIRHEHPASDRTYWVFPGGGKEDGETEEECIAREMKEETNLIISVERLILDEPEHPDGIYKRRKTFLCRPIEGRPKPGFEPELEAAVGLTCATKLIGERNYYKIQLLIHSSYSYVKRWDTIKVHSVSAIVFRSHPS
jgi:8-oxo-dGTP diphosphatase